MITITESAGYKIKEMMADEEGHPYLRVGVTPGGCSGFNYGMGFDHEKRNTDRQLEQQGIRILIDKDSEEFLKGVVIDYKQSMMGGGFTIDNPNAIASCGCGASFAMRNKVGKPEKC